MLFNGFDRQSFEPEGDVVAVSCIMVSMFETSESPAGAMHWRH